MTKFVEKDWFLAGVGGRTRRQLTEEQRWQALRPLLVSRAITVIYWDLSWSYHDYDFGLGWCNRPTIELRGPGFLCKCPAYQGPLFWGSERQVAEIVDFVLGMPGTKPKDMWWIAKWLTRRIRPDPYIPVFRDEVSWHRRYGVLDLRRDSDNSGADAKENPPSASDALRLPAPVKAIEYKPTTKVGGVPKRERGKQPVS